MKNEKIKKILTGVQTAAVVAGIAMMTTGCNKEGKSSCSSCSGKTKMDKPSDPPAGSCGKGSCGKGSCSKGSDSNKPGKGSCGKGSCGKGSCSK